MFVIVGVVPLRFGSRSPRQIWSSTPPLLMSWAASCGVQMASSVQLI